MSSWWFSGDPLRLGETKTPGHRIADLRVGNSSIHTVASPSSSSSISLGAPSSFAHHYRLLLHAAGLELAITSCFIILYHSYPPTVELSSGHHLSVYQLHHFLPTNPVPPHQQHTIQLSPCEYQPASRPSSSPPPSSPA